ncbi:hypothetical protein BCR33DRAFT_784173 [Rhizoclosmatium globosum]|uniref:Uncharacterized protein n=1 Tax=Rhizoclosmatium globosum TaxID=329046 RepID=A0A1Y2CGW2_9FUNG|nr:hypothetical protein BCR33DRAFT_784173 [Rhizoclosmatium globosum]|eukprot:ORY46064.1 hypothetical protein BCR33DRAFT_784173 [Rhizoclosmatium globosum]
MATHGYHNGNSKNNRSKSINERVGLKRITTTQSDKMASAAIRQRSRSHSCSYKFKRVSMRTDKATLGKTKDDLLERLMVRNALPNIPLNKGRFPAKQSQSSFYHWFEGEALEIDEKNAKRAIELQKAQEQNGNYSWDLIRPLSRDPVFGKYIQMLNTCGHNNGFATISKKVLNFKSQSKDVKSNSHGIKCSVGDVDLDKLIQDIEISVFRAKRKGDCAIRGNDLNEKEEFVYSYGKPSALSNGQGDEYGESFKQLTQFGSEKTTINDNDAGFSKPPTAPEQRKDPSKQRRQDFLKWQADGQVELKKALKARVQDRLEASKDKARLAKVLDIIEHDIKVDFYLHSTNDPKHWMSVLPHIWVPNSDELMKELDNPILKQLNRRNANGGAPAVTAASIFKERAFVTALMNTHAKATALAGHQRRESIIASSRRMDEYQKMVEGKDIVVERSITAELFSESHLEALFGKKAVVAPGRKASLTAYCSTAPRQNSMRQTSTKQQRGIKYNIWDGGRWLKSYANSSIDMQGGHGAAPLNDAIKGLKSKYIELQDSHKRELKKFEDQFEKMKTNEQVLELSLQAAQKECEELKDEIKKIREHHTAEKDKLYGELLAHRKKSEIAISEHQRLQKTHQRNAVERQQQQTTLQHAIDDAKKYRDQVEELLHINATLKVRSKLDDHDANILGDELQAEKNRSADLRKENENLMIEMQQAVTRAKQEEHMKLRVVQDCEELVKANVTLKNELEEVQRRLRREFEAREQKIQKRSDHIREADELKQEFNRVKDEYAMLKISIDNKDRKIQDLRAQVNSMENALNTALETRNILEERCEELEDRAKAQERDLIQIGQDKSLLIDDVAELRNTTEIKTIKLQNLIEENRDLKVQVDRFKRESYARQEFQHLIQEIEAKGENYLHLMRNMKSYLNSRRTEEEGPAKKLTKL